MCISSVLQNYWLLSGQIFNLQKSRIFFSNKVTTTNRYHLRRHMGVVQGSFPFIYLGVPIFLGASKSSVFKPIADKILSKFASWKCNSLSLTGRVCLVNFIITSSLVYIMMIYRWPRYILKKIDCAMKKKCVDWFYF